MDIEIVFKIAGIGIITAVLNIILTKAGKDEYVMLTTIAGILIVAFLLTDRIRELFYELEKLFSL